MILEKPSESSRKPKFLFSIDAPVRFYLIEPCSLLYVLRKVHGIAVNNDEPDFPFAYSSVEEAKVPYGWQAFGS